MTDSEKGLGEAAGLWHRARGPWRAAQGAPEAPDAMTLAAYLEGRLGEDAAGVVETWMAADPEALDSVLAARAALGAAPGAAPAHVVKRAQGAVHGRTGRVSGPGRAGWLFAGFGAFFRPAAWASVAAALLLASISGFELGRAGAEHLALLDAAVAQDVRLVMGPSEQNLV